MESVRTVQTILLVSNYSSYHTPNIALEFQTKKNLSKIPLDEDLLCFSIGNPVLSQERAALVDLMA